MHKITTIYTIGHSNHSSEQLIQLLQQHAIRCLVDVRSQPYSGYNPQFNRETLAATLRSTGLQYLDLGASLGGGPDQSDLYDPGEERPNYGRQGQTDLYQYGPQELLGQAGTANTAIMCSEGDPYQCHRTWLITPSLIDAGLTVKRASFLAWHLDADPAAVLKDHQRSLCLIEPPDLWATFQCDVNSGHYQARIGFELAHQPYPQLNPLRGMPVTDLSWRALGRCWLAKEQQPHLQLDRAALIARLNADAIYLSIGLSRSFKGKIWPLLIGVHPTPDYRVVIDYEHE